MDLPRHSLDENAVVDQVLGYLNFSSGNHDPGFFRALDRVFEAVSDQRPEQSASENEADPPESTSLSDVHQRLTDRLTELQETNETFLNADQAIRAIEIVFRHLLPLYREHHRELIFAQSEERLFNSFFVGSAFEVFLTNDGGATESETAASTLPVLNDYLGHRPVATLETRKIEPYSNEWVRPVPILIHGAGVASGRYRAIVSKAFEILDQTDPDILRAAQFDPDRMTELAFDPRAFDFDHPANKRPNYHFGQWDEGSVDNSGFFRRFVIHDVTVDALLDRIDRVSEDETHPIDQAEALTEAAAVLAGTILMASGVSGSGPGAYDSNTTLGSLLPVIAQYRDQFYADLLKRLPEQHRQRLEAEQTVRQQPFGGARQDLNSCLAKRRASQLVNCRLASIFARMGYPDAAQNQLTSVPVASARIACEIDCLLGSINFAMKSKDLEKAFAAVPQIVALLKRGIHCGAIVDPWNILGFDANYSLFPALENTVRDHRVYELVELVELIFAICSRLWSEAAAMDREDMCKAIRGEFLELVEWWRQFAAHQVMSVDAVDALEIFEAAQLVAEALNLWHKGGAATGDISFWSQHAELFDSPKAYSLVISALMQRSDYQTSSALMVHWISNADQIPLQMGDSSFHDLAHHWISEQKALLESTGSSHVESGSPESTGDEPPLQTPERIWNRIRKFYDFIEANAGHYWKVPEFQLDRNAKAGDSEGSAKAGDNVNDLDDDEDDGSSLFRAAYDDVTFTDSADDGFEGEIFDGGDGSEEELDAEVDRVSDRLEFLETIASYWRLSATIPLPVTDPQELTPELEKRLRNRSEIINAWLAQAVDHRDGLTRLIDSIGQYSITTTGSNHEAMLLYDQQRVYKDSLLEQAIHTSIETQNAIRMLGSVVRAIRYLVDLQPLGLVDQNSDLIETTPEHKDAQYAEDDSRLVSVISAILLKNPKLIAEHFEGLLGCLHKYPLLYVPLGRGGEPGNIVCARTLQTHILDLLQRLPALGMLKETHDLLRTALEMERANPIGQGAVTEFDELFEVAYTSMVRALVRSSQLLEAELLQQNPDDPTDAAEQAESQLFDCVEMLTESMLIQWLDHSDTLRLSVLEKVMDSSEAGPWERLVKFVEQYGPGLFTQQFLHAANIRGILHRGVDQWLEEVALNPPDELDTRLIDDLDVKIPRKRAVHNLTLILEGVIENYNAYRDYNTTTTQSDHGGSLYMLLDFLRLRTRYDRVCWKLKPVTWAHRVLVSEQESNVARMWRRSLVERVGSEADKFVRSLTKLRKKYSIQMESIGRRINERFAHQMQIDRLRAQVGPAIADPTERKSRRNFERLCQESQAFARTTTGVGIDLPPWLAALEGEVDQHQLPDRLKNPNHASPSIDTLPVSVSQMREQLESFPRRDSQE